MQHRVTNLSRQAKAYCNQNFSAFEQETREQAFDIICDRAWLTLLALVVGALANVPYAGIVSFGYLGPALTVCVLGAVLSRVPRCVDWVTHHAPTLFDSILLLAVIGLSFLWIYILNNGTRPADNPVQFTLAAVSMLAYRPRFWELFIRNCLYAGVMAGILYVLAPSFFAESVGPFIGGLGIGSWLALLGFNAHRIRFYSLSILKNLNTHLHEELASLVYEHQRRLLESYSPLGKTMELEPKLAYLGEFDIVDSSSLVEYEGYERVKNKVFEKCYARLLKNYAINPNALHRPHCDGHLVKEMGDGFIFSVGFPFDVPEGESGADVAFQMATEFLEIFESEIQELVGARRVQSVVVLTKDVVKAFWTNYKVKRYDFEQKCMTRVARLGEFRRVFQVSDPKPVGSFILMDETFVSDLSQKWKLGLEKIILADHNWRIRNHPEITTMYAMRIGKVPVQKAA